MFCQGQPIVKATFRTHKSELKFGISMICVPLATGKQLLPGTWCTKRGKITQISEVASEAAIVIKKCQLLVEFTPLDLAAPLTRTHVKPGQNVHIAARPLYICTTVNETDQNLRKCSKTCLCKSNLCAGFFLVLLHAWHRA